MASCLINLNAYTVLNNVNETALIADANLDIVWMNDTAGQMVHIYGLQYAEEAIGKSLAFFQLHDETNNHLLNGLHNGDCDTSIENLGLDCSDSD
ncbi:MULTISPECIES: hypothetical protein [Bacillaceae]|uniref:Uncharacterized protein n=1 Tax=Domibacillus aminovorans TaxID=29332 RepID=A0A177KR09_9BACI|nr:MULTISPECIES: hypothetical protein [Bacillaceae]OAH55798.1 hypothetical protein AWH48_03745 [Domibacillus aminovorans]